MVARLVAVVAIGFAIIALIALTRTSEKTVPAGDPIVQDRNLNDSTMPNPLEKAGSNSAEDQALGVDPPTGQDSLVPTLVESYRAFAATDKLSEQDIQRASVILYQLGELQPSIDAFSAIAEALSQHQHQRSFNQIRGVAQELVSQLIVEHDELRSIVEHEFESTSSPWVVRMLGSVLLRQRGLFVEPSRSYSRAIQATNDVRAFGELLANVASFRDDKTTLELIDYAMRSGAPDGGEPRGVVTLYDNWRRFAGSHGSRDLVLSNLRRDLPQLALRPAASEPDLASIESILRACGFVDEANRVVAIIQRRKP